ncbi:MAG TPA: hypothetical protein PKB06_05715, partial [Actinotalea sp.]|nr:hypothetical protein [Actinotalea sp.]
MTGGAVRLTGSGLG